MEWIVVVFAIVMASILYIERVHEVDRQIAEVNRLQRLLYKHGYDPYEDEDED